MRKEEEDSAAALRGKEGKGSRKGGQGGGRSSANNVNHTPEGERGGLCARSPPCRVTLEAAKQREREREGESLKDEKAAERGRGEVEAA